MARLSSAFDISFRKEEDRIDKKRKENREAFEKFREMKVKNGDQVTAQDFQQYRQSLAGGDNFMLKNMGPGNMLEDMAKRTNEQSLLTRTKEDSEFAEAREKTYKLFETFVGDNLDLDPTDFNKGKKKFMQLFNDNPELGEEIWDQNKGRYTEALTTERTTAAQSFADSLLKDVHTKDEAQKIMSMNNVPPWKQSAILSIIERKEATLNTDTTAKARELANAYSMPNVRFFNENEIDNAVEGILQQAKVNSSVLGQGNYDALKLKLKATLQAKVNNAQAADLETNKKLLEKNITTDKRFLLSGQEGAGWHSQETLDIVNSIRRSYLGPNVVDLTLEDDEFKNYIHIANIHNRNQYGEKHTKELEKATKLAETKVESIAGAIDAQAAGFDANSSGYIAISTLTSNGNVLRPGTDPLIIRGIIENQFGADAVKSDNSDNQTIREILNKISVYFVPKSKLMNELIQNNMTGVGFKPNSDFEAESKNDVKIFSDENNPLSMAVFLKTVRSSLTVNQDPESPAFKRALDKLETEFNNDIDATIAYYKKSKGAFSSFSNDTNVDAQINTLKAALEKSRDDLLADIRSGKVRGTKLPPASYDLRDIGSNDAKQGYRRMKVDLVKKVMNQQTGEYEDRPVTYKDSDIPVKANDVVRIDEDGNIISRVQDANNTATNQSGLLSQVMSNPGKVGTDLLQGGSQFAAFLPRGMSGGIDTNTTNQQMAETIKNLYSAMKSSGNLPEYIRGGQGQGRPVQSEFEFGQSILSDVDYFATRRGGFQFTNNGIYNLLDR
tara:strand:+ start:14760 stop:17108 length:2349 start_codon:yes stop_codon:yes gene_type:complete